MILVLENKNTCVGVVELPDDFDRDALKREFDDLVAPPDDRNPFLYDTPAQKEWIARCNVRRDWLVKTYGGSESGSHPPYEIVFGPETLIGWLVKEKGAREVPWHSIYHDW